MIVARWAFESIAQYQTKIVSEMSAQKL